MFPELDIALANKILKKVGEDADKFMDWLLDQDDEIIASLFRSEYDIVSLVYEYLIYTLDDSDAVIENIAENALFYVYSDALDNHIDCNLSDNEAFRKMLLDNIECKTKVTDNAKLLKMYFKVNNIDYTGDKVLKFICSKMKLYI